MGEGEPVSLENLARRSNLTTQDVQNIISALPASNIIYGANNNIIGFRGLGLKPSAHKIVKQEKTLYAWCAFDCLFLPELLNGSLDIRSTCPETGDEIYLTASPQGISKASSDTIFVSFVVPNLSEYKDDLRGNFCCHVNFFTTHKAGLAWASNKEGIILIDLENALSLAHIRNETGFGNQLALG